MRHGSFHACSRTFLLALLFIFGLAGCQLIMSGKEDPNRNIEPRCGDGVVQSPEHCDQEDLGGKNCVALGIGEGDLACFEDCTYDARGCSAASRNAQLRTLLVSQGTLTPPFDPWTRHYSMNVSNRVRVLTVTALAQDANAHVEITPVQPMSLDFGENLVSVNVTAQHGEVETYELVVNRMSLLSMIDVPGGTFHWSSSPEDYCFVSTFQISQTEITRPQYLLVMGVDPSSPEFSGDMDGPVQMANWYHAISFCNRLSLMDGLTPVYQVDGVDFASLLHEQIPIVGSDVWDAVTIQWEADGYRLPTEMEWMWAAMGAVSSYDKAFAGSSGTNAIGDHAVFGYVSTEEGRTEFPRSEAVGSKLPNELGIFDMSGNVWEWVWDWYDVYPSGAVADYRGPASGQGRVVRGGSWNDASDACAVAHRTSSPPSYQNVKNGFRVVRQKR